MTWVTEPPLGSSLGVFMAVPGVLKDSVYICQHLHVCSSSSPKIRKPESAALSVQRHHRGGSSGEQAGHFVGTYALQRVIFWCLTVRLRQTKQLAVSSFECVRANSVVSLLSSMLTCEKCRPWSYRLNLQLPLA